MNTIQQKLVSLRNRARHIQASLRRWSLYCDEVSGEMKEDLLVRFTPAEQAAFPNDLELTRTRLKPVATQLKTLSRWYDYVLEQTNDQLDRARTMLDQGRPHDALAILNDAELRTVLPNEDTFGFVFQVLRQHTSHELHQKLVTIDAIMRDLYLPTVKLAHQRGLVPKECLSRTPLAYLADVPEGRVPWQHHVQLGMNLGRQIPVSLVTIPRRLIGQPWSIVAVAHDVGRCVYHDLNISWEIAGKLQTESVSGGVRPQAAVLWAQWHETLFADVFATLKLGPAYVSGMIETLGSDPIAAVTIQANSPVPPAYIRWHVMLQTLTLMNLGEPARELFSQVHLLCGDPNRLAMQLGSSWLAFVTETRAVAGLIALSPCRKLGGGRIVDFVQPIAAVEMSTSGKVKDVLLAGDESCSNDHDFHWVETLQHIPTPAHIGLAGLRLAFDATAEFETSRRLCVRFWCMMQYLMGSTEPQREREDREFAPPDAVLKQIAQNTVPAMTAGHAYAPGGAMPFGAPAMVAVGPNGLPVPMAAIGNMPMSVMAGVSNSGGRIPGSPMPGPMTPGAH